MRIIEQKRGYFEGIHKGCSIVIESDKEHEQHKFYTRVRWKDGGMICDGYTPEEIKTMAHAKREAIQTINYYIDNILLGE